MDMPDDLTPPPPRPLAERFASAVQDRQRLVERIAADLDEEDRIRTAKEKNP